MKNKLLLIVLTSFLFLMVACKKDLDFNFLETEIRINVGSKSELKFDNANLEDLEFTYSQNGIITIEANEVLGISPGEVIVTGRNKINNSVDTIKVIVSKINVTSISIDGLSNGFVNEEITLSLIINPSNATNITVEWMSSNEELATVDDNGLVTLIKAGTVVIEATIDDLKASHEIVINNQSFTVTFYNYLDEVIKTEIVLKGDSANAPALSNINNYMFMRWNFDFTNVESNLEVRPLYYQSYVTYQEEYNINELRPIELIVDNIPRTNPFRTFTNVYHGGFRQADQIHFYNQTNLINRNNFGFEIAVDSNGLVTEKNSLVSLPPGGFILSGHSSTATILSSFVNIGDLIVYDQETKSAYLYRDANNSKLIALNIEITQAIKNIVTANDNYLALNYTLIHSLLNDSIDYYNILINEYNNEYFDQAKLHLLEIAFLLIEATPVQTNAVWHYPTRSGIYFERNLGDIENVLDEYAKMGINRIYLNTNFNGGSVYKSNYLTQQMTASNIYEGYKDYLEAFIAVAHERNILVYAWTNTLIAGDGRNNPYYATRDWILKGYNNEDNFNGMYFVDISNDEVKVFLNNVYTELASNYNLDGIEFDFIRYPSGNLASKKGAIPSSTKINDGGYTDSFINKFSETTGYNGNLKEDIRNNEVIREQWLDFKIALLSEFVKDLTTSIKAANNTINITAAVMPSINTALNIYGQDWDNWIENNYLVGLEPMIYSGDANAVLASLTNMINIVNNRAFITVGLFPEDVGADVIVLAEQIAKLTSNYAVGVSRFSSKTIFAHPYAKDAMRHLYRANTAQTNHSDELIIYAYISDLLEKTTNYYQHVIDAEKLLNYLESINLDENNNYYAIIESINDEIMLLDNQIIQNRLLITNDLMRLLLE